VAEQKKEPPPLKLKERPPPPKPQPNKNLNNPIDANERLIDVQGDHGR
jgi:hypothetical protein